MSAEAERTPTPSSSATRTGQAWRWLRHAPQLLVRTLQRPNKRAYFRQLVNTYYGNYINLSLVFRRTKSDREIRRLARRTLYTYLRNEAFYHVPKLWPGFDLDNPQALEAALDLGKGVVVGGQHLGPQRYSFIQLALTGRTVYVLVTENFIDRGQRFLDRVADDLGSGPQVDAARRLVQLPAESPTVALKMVRALRRGDLVMFDIDGNIGVGGEEGTLKEAMTLSFFGREIHVRKGVAYLSYRTGAPILPLIPLWGRRGRPQLRFFDPILPQEDESLEDYTERSLRQLYGLLEKTLLERPDQWEEWPTFYKWLSPPEKLDQAADTERRLESLADTLRGTLEQAPASELSVHPDEAFVLHIRGRRVFVDSRNFRFFLTSPSAEDALRHLHRGTTLGDLVQRLQRKYRLDTVLQELARLELLQLLVLKPATRLET